MQKILDDVEGAPIVLRNFNTKVGGDINASAGVIGKHGEETINDNSKRLNDVANHLLVANKMFPHNTPAKNRAGMKNPS